jgi:peptidoglycan/xylan/chitin deacetylase (PgdA/CDA1 family)
MTEVIFLCFHYLKRSDQYARIYGYELDDFKNNIEHLHKDYPIVSFSDFKLFLQGQKQLPQKCSLISFDDGLLEHAEVFAPYLKEKNVSALFCLPTCILRGEMSGVQVIHFMTARYGIRNFLQFLREYFAVTNLAWDEYFDGSEDKLEISLLYQKIKEVLMKKMPGDKVYTLLQTLYKEVLYRDDPKILSKVYFDKDGLKKILELDHEIGCHSDTHPFFVNLDIDNDEVWNKEILNPRKILSAYTEQDIDIFAYPFGDNINGFDFDKWTNKLRQSGFKYALNAYKSEGKQTEKFNPFWIQRYCVQSHDQIENLNNHACHYLI